MLHPILKFGHIPHGEHKFVIETLLKLLELLHIIEALSTTMIDDLMASSSRKQVMMQYMEPQTNVSTTLDEKSKKLT